ncbi:hypothetical protein ACI2L1_32170 [Streptomyces sp. NPDC019531]|uniref:hypothetical protein n=1 Tax=Streptomyces sp. NPDC019531 TaxID=3365062 RepID=UPI00384EBCEC
MPLGDTRVVLGERGGARSPACAASEGDRCLASRSAAAPPPCSPERARYSACVVVSDAADRAETALRGLGHGFRERKSTVTDLDTMKINRRPASRR